MTESDKSSYLQLNPFKTGLACACPRCGKGKLFDGLLKLKKACTACKLDYGFVDTGEGPAVLVMLVVGFIVLGSALWLDQTFQPSVLIHAIIWIPTAVLLSLFLLRVMKAIMIALQYRHSAAEGRLDRD